MEDDTTDDLEIDDTIVDEAERESVVVSRSPSEAALCDDRDNPSGDDGDVTNQNGKVTAVEENLDEMDVDVCEANKENTSDPATKDGEADVVVSTTVAANDVASGSGEVTNNLDGEDIQDESDDKSLDKSKKKNSKGPAYSALNRRINGALQTTKAKVEEFQEKYGGEPDFILIMRDNMTEINDTGRPSRTNRKVIVTGAGPLCEEFKFNGIRFSPKDMIFTKKGKTLEKDFDMLEDYIEKRCGNVPQPAARKDSLASPDAPISIGRPMASLYLTPSRPIPSSSSPTTTFVQLLTSPSTSSAAALASPHTPSLTLPVSPSTFPGTLAASPPQDSTRISVSHEEDPKEMDIVSSKQIVINSGSECSGSDHGVHIGGKKNIPGARRKSNPTPARRKSNPLLKNDILAAKPKATAKAKAVVKPTNKGENKKANKKKTAEPASIPAVRVVDKVTDWLERQTDDTNEDDETIALPKKKPGKPTNVRTLGLVSEPASVSGMTVMPRAGPVSSRTMEIMSRVKSKVAAPKATMTEEEIEAVLSDKDSFLTPRKKRVRMAPL